MKLRDPIEEANPEVHKRRFASYRKNLDPMEDKKHNTPGHSPNGFYWVPICFSFFPVFFAFAFGLPLFPKTPAIYIGEEIAVSSLSGYELMFLSPITSGLFAVTIASWAYLIFVGIFTAFMPKYREVGKMNLLLFPALILLCVSTMVSLFSMVSYVGTFDHSSTIPGYTPFDFVEITYWALLIVPFLLLIWWVAVNLSNLHQHKLLEEGAKESLESPNGESDGEENARQEE